MSYLKITANEFKYAALWLYTTPLDFPVEPEVKFIEIGSFSSLGCMILKSGFPNETRSS
ncbi:hypothetical protein HanRHA438_Chr15g0713451 [Helianthus annuus]|nr:hypothetical protein HanRHA438_Chr15g0713451 [Helianthus annuus]